ncbi:unnamed protein product [Dibothriocephalus latus]|uniref:Uncharacterized protein n=1 Tax=Dibothriocephalus latus TaxID=60516 RepID=A0A3P6RKX1_DIBLA|nr:unnamed protein product [Dibothriocephalus latus]
MGPTTFQGYVDLVRTMSIGCGLSTIDQWRARSMLRLFAADVVVDLPLDVLWTDRLLVFAQSVLGLADAFDWLYQTLFAKPFIPYQSLPPIPTTHLYEKANIIHGLFVS